MATRRPTALRHGIYSESLVLPSENARHLRQLRTALRAALKPVGAVEELLADQVVTAAWRLRRYAILEACLVSCAGAELGAPVEIDFGRWAEIADSVCPPAEPAQLEPDAPTDAQRLTWAYTSAVTSHALQRLWLQEARVGRELRAGLRGLWALQRARGETGLPEDADPAWLTAQAGGLPALPVLPS
jgi:hypothetical protein